MKSRDWIQKCQKVCLGKGKTLIVLAAACAAMRPGFHREKPCVCLCTLREFTERHTQMLQRLEFAARKYCKGSQLPCQEQKLHPKRSHAISRRAQLGRVSQIILYTVKKRLTQDRFQNRYSHITVVVNAYSLCDNTTSHRNTEPHRWVLSDEPVRLSWVPAIFLLIVCSIRLSFPLPVMSLLLPLSPPDPPIRLYFRFFSTVPCQLSNQKFMLLKVLASCVYRVRSYGCEANLSHFCILRTQVCVWYTAGIQKNIFWPKALKWF